MNELLANAGRRFYLKHPWQLCLAVTGIALGVAVYVGVDVANNSARRAFELSADLITGRTTHHLMAIKGNISNSQYRELRRIHLENQSKDSRTNLLSRLLLLQQRYADPL